MDDERMNGLCLNKDEPLTMGELRALPPWTRLVIENLDGPADFFELVTLKQDDPDWLKGAVRDGPYDLPYEGLNVYWRAYRGLTGHMPGPEDNRAVSGHGALSGYNAAFLSRLKKDLDACMPDGAPRLWTIRSTELVPTSFDKADVSLVHDDLRHTEWPVDDMGQIWAFLNASTLAADAMRMYGTVVTAEPQPDGSTYVVIHDPNDPGHTTSAVVRNADTLDSIIQSIQQRGGYGATFPYRVRSYKTRERQYPDAMFLTPDGCAEWLDSNKGLYGRDPRVVPVEGIRDPRYARLLDVLRGTDWGHVGP